MTVLDTELMGARKTGFLEAYALTGVIGPACDAVGISRSCYQRWRREDGDFDAACADAFDAAVDAAELELRTRGVEGVEEVVLYKGEPVWRRDPHTGHVLLDDEFNPIPFTIHRRSDRLLEVYAKAHRPVYREKSGVELTGKDGMPLVTDITVKYVLPDGRTAADYDETEVPGGGGADEEDA